MRMLWFPITFIESIFMLSVIGLFFPSRYEKRKPLFLQCCFSAVFALISITMPINLMDLLLVKLLFVVVLFLCEGKILYIGRTYYFLLPIGIGLTSLLLIDNLVAYVVGLLSGGIVLLPSLMFEATYRFLTGYSSMLLKFALLLLLYRYKLKNNIVKFGKFNIYQLIFCLFSFQWDTSLQLPRLKMAR